MSSEITSISHYSSYTDICKSAANYDDVFNNFKKLQEYTKILEHTSIEYGYEYLNILLNKYNEKDILNILESVSINDIYGNSSKHNYKVYNKNIFISPSTLNYTKVWSDINQIFGKTENMNIVEIGGGYGGQCLVANAFSGFKSYTIYDLPEANLLQQKYLSKNNVHNVSFFSSPTKNNNINNISKYDLLISNYAFSELNRHIQEEYLNKVLLNSNNGYMIMNFGWNLPNLFTVEELKKVLKSLVLHEEMPKTGPYNCLLTWKE